MNDKNFYDNKLEKKTIFLDLHNIYAMTLTLEIKNDIIFRFPIP